MSNETFSTPMPTGALVLPTYSCTVIQVEDCGGELAVVATEVFSVTTLDPKTAAISAVSEWDAQGRHDTSDVVDGPLHVEVREVGSEAPPRRYLVSAFIEGGGGQALHALSLSASLADPTEAWPDLTEKPSLIAYGWRSGRIEFGTAVPKGAAQIIEGPPAAIRRLIAGGARLGYDGAWLVPGVPEAQSDDEAFNAMLRFIERMTATRAAFDSLPIDAPLPWRVGDEGGIEDAEGNVVLLVEPTTTLGPAFNAAVALFVVAAVNAAGGRA